MRRYVRETMLICWKMRDGGEGRFINSPSTMSHKIRTRVCMCAGFAKEEEGDSFFSFSFLITISYFDDRENFFFSFAAAASAKYGLGRRMEEIWAR